MSVYSDPALWEQAKAEARKRMGGHSARAMQLAGRLYRAAGGRYLGKPTKAQKSLEQWTDQDWTTKSGKPSRQTGERYLPRKVIEKLTPAEYGATTRAKRKGTAAGQQFVKQPARIAAKVAALKANPTMKKLPVLSFDGDVVGYAGMNAHKQAMALSGGESIKQELKVVDGIKRLVWVPIKRKENPIMKKPTPAQLAARARFAEMARSGAFKRKAKAKKAAPKKATTTYSVVSRDGAIEAKGLTLAEARKFIADKAKRTKRFAGYWSAIKTNPAKKTVSEKISQLTREGYPQKQAIAIALNEERAGKVKRNPRAANPATGTKKSRTKLNPVQYRDIAKDTAPARVQYAVHLADRPSYHAMAYFTKKADALAVAKEVADRTGKTIAVSRVQVHFGPM